MPAAPIPNSAGFAQPDNAGQQAAMMGGQRGGGKAAAMGGLGTSRAGVGTPSGGGEIVISRAEAAALTVFETEDDSAEAYRRAAEESGLTHSQIQRLKSRAESARGKGFMLKGGNIVLRPKQDGATDERGLVWHTKKEKAEEDALSAADKQEMSAKERSAYMRARKMAKADDPKGEERRAKALAKSRAEDDEVEKEVERVKKGAVKEAASSELEEVFDHIEFGTPLNEMWSDAARAAAVAARKARKGGGNWRIAAATAYTKGKGGRSAAVKSFKKALRHPDEGKSLSRASAKAWRITDVESNASGLKKTKKALYKAGAWD